MRSEIRSENVHAGKRPSGSIAIGATSDEIKVTLAACPSTVLFQDKDHSIQTGTRVDFCDPNQLG